MGLLCGDNRGAGCQWRNACPSRPDHNESHWCESDTRDDNFAGEREMEESPQIIRQQMDETRSQLSEKLESLELQVSETVQSTGATVEAIQETVEPVTGAVQ